ncbi:MAG: hypothetical protein P857_396 [Candidatus Xenolissoclinum pacificiensis L6]|uniref:Uncharacterized protein n=1 Tax=Candidatus Xenolissoclinum pacificiensis L6 TaxID=1401685 RepID=W2V0V2_9RICK|nr:MAG: hypothetical protein P857_396 [Candidatus Xenolissoclinum pacificiensis L6]
MLVSFFAVSLVYGIVGTVVALILSPLQCIKILRQDTGHSYYSLFHTIIKEEGVLYFYRAAMLYAMMNFLSNFSFGIADVTSVFLSHNNPMLRLAVRIFVGGFVETLLTFYVEIKEILKNKEHYSKSEFVYFSEVSLLLLLRNSVVWIGSAVSMLLFELYHFNFYTAFLISLVLGLIFSVLSLPLDVFSTVMCGTSRKSFSENICVVYRSHKQKLFYGATIRTIQVTAFTIATAITGMILQLVYY